MIVLGIDWGRARVGVAASDEMGLLAHPVATLQVASEARLLDELAALAKQHRAAEIVLGLPLNMDGTEGDSAQAARRLADNLGRAAGVPVHLRDERLTSWAAGERLADAGLSNKKQKGVRDQMAACLILQAYLDSLKK